MRAANPDRICGQIGQRYFLKTIIPFIPLTADLKNGHGVRLPYINALDA
jgi:hypothetical protein